MNNYEDIFDREDKDSEQKIVEDFENQIKRTEKNGLLIAVYFVVMLFVSFGFSFYAGFVYPDTEAILDGINDTTPVIVQEVDSIDSEYAYEVIITGVIENNSDTDIQSLFIQVEFFDENEASLGIYTYDEEDVLIGDSMVINDSFLTDTEFFSYEVIYGIDVYNNTTTFFNLLPVLLCSIIFFVVDRECFKMDGKAFKKNVGRNIGWIFLGFLMVYAALYISNIILYILGVTETSLNEIAIQNMFTSDPGQLIMLFGLLVVFTPIVEEVVFRKVLYNFVDKRLGTLAAILASGLVFGLLHVVQHGDFIQAIPYVLMGTVFGVIYFLNRKNIWVTIAVHSLNNLVSYLLYLFLILSNGSI